VMALNQVVVGRADQAPLRQSFLLLHPGPRLVPFPFGQRIEHTRLWTIGAVADHLAEINLAVDRAHLQRRHRPEGPEALVQDECQQAEDHGQTDGQGAAVHPDHRQTVSQQRQPSPGAWPALGRDWCRGSNGLWACAWYGCGGRTHSWYALLRKRCRITSATVLSTKVMANSVRAARNKVRKWVLSRTASGNSTAMLADRV